MELSGTFTEKKSGINMLTDPIVLERLAKLHKDAKEDGRAKSPDGDHVVEEVLDQLRKNINSYNMRHLFGKYTVHQTEGFDFEGSMQFHLEDASGHRPGNRRKSSSTKCVKLTNKINIRELIPILTNKFGVSKQDKMKKSIYQVQEMDEILLAPEECPLDIAVNSKRTVRFVLRLHKMEPPPKEQIEIENEPRHRKALSAFFGVDRNELNSPFAPPGSDAGLSSSTGKFIDESPLERQGTVDSISSNSSSGSTPRSDRPLSGLLLKTQTGRYRQRGKSNEETKSESGTPSMKRKSSKRQRFRTTSLSSMLARSLSMRSEGKNSKELSTEESIPGLLKIFGSHICPESQYRSVLATRQSFAVELIKEVLERYNLSRDSYHDFVLCDVIGNYQVASHTGRKSSVALTNMRDERVWVTECIRVLRDTEKPLQLSAFWKPEDGYLRRFEIRKRSEVESDITEDNITHGINVNAKRIQMTQSHYAHTIDIPDAHAHSSRQQVVEVFDSNEEAKKPSQRKSDIPDTRSSTPDAKRRVSEREETESSDEPTAVYNLAPPRDCPYLLTLKGKDPELDLILYLLHQQACLIGGSHDDKESTEHLVIDITLEAQDILPHHCWIFQRQVSNPLANVDEYVYDISIEPISDAPVMVNGSLISSNTGLTSGDIICVGRHYMFMFKDPSSEQRDVDIQHFHPKHHERLERSEGQQEVKEIKYETQDVLSINFECANLDWVAPNAHINKKAQDYYMDTNKLKISYQIEREDAILDYIGSMQPGRDGRGFGLSPAYVLVMCLEHAAYYYDQRHTKDLIIRAAALVHSLAWDKTKELASKQPKKLIDVHKVLRVLLPHLRTIVFWMANALELLHFFHSHMEDYVGQSESEEESGDGLSQTVSFQDEITAELEEVVMYTFQQSVYYLTKTLYIALPNILDTNPFLDEDKGQDERSQGMEEVIHVFQTTFDLLYSLDVHPQITSQLFAYLLFFTNASLFNMVMERGSTGNFFKWSKGAQVRGNLDILDGWIQEHGLGEQLHFLNHVSMAADLLATPKLQLMQADWGSIRRDFPSLNAAQLQQILSKYQLGTNPARPKGWFPPHDQVEAALRTDDILESFENHPPLVLPNTDFKLNLKYTPSDPSFRLQVQRLCKAVSEVSVHLGQPSEHKQFSSRFKASSMDDAILTRSESTPFHLSNLEHQEIEPHHYSAPSSSTYDQAYHNRHRKLSRVLEAEAIVENAESHDQDLRTITVTMTPTAMTPTSGAPAISLTPPNHNEEVLLEPPTEFANDEEETDEAEAEMFGGQEEEKHDGRTEISHHQIELKDENENHPSSPEDLPRNDSVVSMISLDCNIDEQYIRVTDKDDSQEDVFVVDLEKCEAEGLGLGLIDGMHTALRSPGIYVRKLVTGGAAVKDGRLKLGDRILAVNGTSLVGADYQSAMHLIKTSGETLRFLVAKSERTVMLKITSSSC